jgi:hypothetical protein
MSETQAEGAAPALPPEVLAACDIAASGREADGEPRTVSASGHRRYGRGHWRRLVWRAGAWRPFADRALARHADPDDIVPGIVRPGELVLHQRGASGRVTAAYLVCDAPSQRPLKLCDFAELLGALRITLPDGRQVERPNPRRR